MAELYRVCWNLKNGRDEGRGQPLSKELAEDTAKCLNEEFPNAHHWVEPVRSSETHE